MMSQTDTATALPELRSVPPTGSYWAYFSSPPANESEHAEKLEAVLRVEGEGDHPNGTSRLELLVCFKATPSELDPHKLDGLCRLETKLNQLEATGFWDKVAQGNLQRIGHVIGED
jgi:hypothetical protein